uniref:Uncharacterized protein n=1 Tax=Mycolicibacterium gilvum (strain PYR-GCK) TaxID=350054 RepID=A4T0Q4_MYCGI|nr:hypothetical protein Mflv_0368 [Mycolicibacterium gilvum PYR-GCK]
MTSDDVTVAGQRALVMGASGNVGACVTRHLAAGGADVRVLLRPTSSTRGIDGADIDRRLGDPFDPRPPPRRWLTATWSITASSTPGPS